MEASHRRRRAQRERSAPEAAAYVRWREPWLAALPAEIRDKLADCTRAVPRWAFSPGMAEALMEPGSREARRQIAATVAASAWGENGAGVFGFRIIDP